MAEAPATSVTPTPRPPGQPKSRDRDDRPPAKPPKKAPRKNGADRRQKGNKLSQKRSRKKRTSLGLRRIEIWIPANTKEALAKAAKAKGGTVGMMIAEVLGREFSVTGQPVAGGHAA